MNRRFALVVALAVATPLVGCKKDGGSAGAGALDPAERDLLKYIPGGAPVLFGGNYMKLQNLMQGGLGQLTAALDKMAPGMSTWTQCFTEVAEHKLHGAGAVDMSGKDTQLRMAFSGVTVDDVAGCAQKASFKTTIDADKKFVSIEMPMLNMPGATASYLVLPSGALYTRFNFSIGIAKPMSTSRAELEADIAGVKATAADDPTLAPLLAKVDHSKTVWFVGHGDGTPIADKVGDMYGTFDLSTGLALDIVAQIKDPDVTKKLDEGIGQAKKSADSLPGDLKDVVKSMTFDHSGKDVHFSVKVSSDQLKSIMGQFGGMLGGGMGARTN